jgi:hypothetical protein
MNGWAQEHTDEAQAAGSGALSPADQEMDMQTNGIAGHENVDSSEAFKVDCSSYCLGFL